MSNIISDKLPLVVQVIEDYTTFEQIKEMWNDLLEDELVESLWLRHEWFDCWWQAFGTSKRMYISILNQNNRPVMILPLMIEKTRLKFINAHALRFIENGITPRCNFIAAELQPDYFRQLWQTLEKKAGDWDLAILENIPTDSPGYKLFKSFLQDEGVSFLEEPARMSPYIDLEAGWEDYLQRLGRDMRRNIKRARNRISEEGEFSVVEINDPNKISKYIEICFDISKRSWKGSQGKDLGGKSDRQEFYQKFSVIASQQGWLSIWLLKVAKKYIAFELHLGCGNEVLPVAADFDLTYKSSSPGVALRSLILERLASRGLRRYDFGGTVYAYKMQWTKQVKPHARFWIFNRRLTSRLLCIIKTHILSRARVSSE